MGTRMPAAYFREYRARNRERIAANERSRRQRPDVLAIRRAAAHAATARARRKREAWEAQVERTMRATHPLEDRARELAGRVSRGTTYSFQEELDWEDAVMAGATAMLEGSDPIVAIRDEKRSWKQWRYHVWQRS